MTIAQKFLVKKSPGLRLIVSFADPSAGHHGGIYQASGWLYCGASVPSYEFRLNGKRLQKRAYTGANYGSPKMVLPEGAVKIATPGKHRYLMPLDKEMSARIAPLAKPYPKRVKQAMSGIQPEQRRCDTDLPAPLDAENQFSAEVAA
jgi:hypothetical protein